MAYAGTYRIRGVFLDMGAATTNTGCDYLTVQPSRHYLWNEFEAFEREEKARQMFAWKEPKKRIPVSTVLIIRKYEKRFTGCKFPVGGPKK